MKLIHLKNIGSNRIKGNDVHRFLYNVAQRNVIAWGISLQPLSEKKGGGAGARQLPPDYIHYTPMEELKGS
jgi:hypothetical protein